MRNITAAVAVALAIISSALVLNVWMYALQPTAPVGHEEKLRVTDVQFVPNYLEITVRNEGDLPTTVIRATVIAVNRTEDGSLFLPAFNVTVNEIVPQGEQRSMFAAYDWISGSRYLIGLTSESGSLNSQTRYFFRYEAFQAP